MKIRSLVWTEELFSRHAGMRTPLLGLVLRTVELRTDPLNLHPLFKRNATVNGR